MTLVSISEVRALVKTSLSDDELGAVIERIESEITAWAGLPQDDANSVTITQTLRGGAGTMLLFIINEIGSVVSVVEDDTTLDASQYRAWIGGMLERLPDGTNWGDVVVVTFRPADDRLQRKAAIIDLVRIDLNRTAMESENIAGEYSYTAPKNWDAERKRIIRRIGFVSAG